MKKVLFSLLLVTSLCLAGCGGPKTATFDEFKTAAESLGFTVTVNGDKMTATKGSCSVDYTKAATEEDADKLYKENVGEESPVASLIAEYAEVMTAKGGRRGGVRRSSSSHSSKPSLKKEAHHSSESNGQASYATRHRSFFFFFHGPSSCRTDVEALAKKLGY